MGSVSSALAESPDVVNIGVEFDTPMMQQYRAIKKEYSDGFFNVILNKVKLRL